MVTLEALACTLIGVPMVIPAFTGSVNAPAPEMTNVSVTERVAGGAAVRVFAGTSRVALYQLTPPSEIKVKLWFVLIVADPRVTESRLAVLAAVKVTGCAVALMTTGRPIENVVGEGSVTIPAAEMKTKRSVDKRVVLPAAVRVFCWKSRPREYHCEIPSVKSVYDWLFSITADPSVVPSKFPPEAAVRVTGCAVALTI